MDSDIVDMAMIIERSPHFCRGVLSGAVPAGSGEVVLHRLDRTALMAQQHILRKRTVGYR
jgi:hypothetical protein